MPTKPKSPKKAKRTNWKQECEAYRSLYGLMTEGAREEQRRAMRWQETARQHCRNEEFYRSIVVKIGEPFGVAAKTSDDGSVQQDVLALKVPELVTELRKRAEATERHNAELLREVEELRADYQAVLSDYKRLSAKLMNPPTFGNRLRAFLRGFSRKGMSAAE